MIRRVSLQDAFTDYCGEIMISRSFDNIVYPNATALLAFLERGDGPCHASRMSVTGDRSDYTAFVRLMRGGAARFPCMRTVHWYYHSPFKHRPLPYRFYVAAIVNTFYRDPGESKRNVDLFICTPCSPGENLVRDRVWLHVEWDISRPDMSRSACSVL